MATSTIHFHQQRLGSSAARTRFGRATLRHAAALRRVGQHLRMSHDGCEEVTWKGQAFPYLLHQPAKPDSYAAHRNRDVAATAHASPSGNAYGSSDTMTRAGTGTWNGPAPRGELRGATAAAAAANDSASAATAAPVREPETTLLSNGTRLPMIGLGTYKIDSPDTIKAALELGYRHFDCASMYGNQSVVAEGLKDFIASGRRSELIITSKIWQTEHRPADAKASVERSIKELGCEYIDLLLVHWPEAWLPGSDINGEIKPDTEVTLQDTWQALEELVDAGHVRGLGVSNCSLAQVESTLEYARHKVLVNQVELHPLLAQRKLVGVSYRKGVISIAHSCLGRKSQGTGDSLLEHPMVIRIAKETGKTPGQVLLKWNMQRGVPVIPKASSPKRLAENFTDMCSWRLSNDQKATLDALDEGKRFIDYPWKDWGDVEEGGVAKPSIVLAKAAQQQQQRQ